MLSTKISKVRVSFEDRDQRRAGQLCTMHVVFYIPPRSAMWVQEINSTLGECALTKDRRLTEHRQ